MLIKTAVFMVILLVIVVFGQMCVAGMWIDDFSDPTLRDWGSGLIDGKIRVAVVDGHFNYRGKKQRARHGITNSGVGKIQDFSLTLKFMFRHIRVPEESYWSIRHYLFNEVTREPEGIIGFEFRYYAAEPNVAFVSIVRTCRSTIHKSRSYCAKIPSPQPDLPYEQEGLVHVED